MTNYVNPTAIYSGQVTPIVNDRSSLHLIPYQRSLNNSIDYASISAIKRSLTTTWAEISGHISDNPELQEKFNSIITQIEALIEAQSSLFDYKGSVNTEADLPQTGNRKGECYNVLDTGANYAWNGTEWDKLSETIDLSPYITRTELEELLTTIVRTIADEQIQAAFTEAISDLTNKLNTAETDISDIKTDINNLEADIEDLDTVIQEHIENAEMHNATKIELAELEQKVNTNTTNIEANTTAINALSNTVQEHISDAEAHNATKADLENYYTKAQIDSQVNTMSDEISSISSDLTDEIISRENNNTQLQNALDALTSANTGKHDELEQAIADEVQARTTADTNLEQALKDYINEKTASIFKYKGQVETSDLLPQDAVIGDTYNVVSDGANYTWNGTAWDKLSETIDLTPFATTEALQAVNDELTRHKQSAYATYATKTALQDAINNLNEEINNRLAKDAELKDYIDAEIGTVETHLDETNTTIRTLDNSVNTTISNLESNINATIQTLATKGELDSEREARENYDSITARALDSLSNDLNTEAVNRENADNTLSESISNLTNIVNTQIETSQSEHLQLQTNIDNLDTAYKAADTEISASISNLEASNATAHENLTQSIDDLTALHNLDKDTLQTNINNIENAYIAADAEINTSIENLATENTSAHNNITDSITTLDGKVDDAVSEITDSINALDTAYKAADTNIEGQISDLNDELTTTINTKEQALQTNIDNAITKAENELAITKGELNNSIVTVSNKIDNQIELIQSYVNTKTSELITRVGAEETARADGDTAVRQYVAEVNENILTALNAENQSAKDDNDTLKADLEVEISDAIAGVNNTITTKENALKAEDVALNTKINNLNTAITNSINTTNANLAQEILDRQAADTQLESTLRAYIQSETAAVFKYKGQVENEAALPTENLEIGFCYNLEDEGYNVVWNGEDWDKLSETLDLSYLLTKEEFNTYKDDIAGRLTTINNTIADEITARQTADNTINDTIDHAVSTLNTNINTTKSELNDKIDTNVTTINGKIDTLNNTASLLRTDITTTSSNLAETRLDVRELDTELTRLKTIVSDNSQYSADTYATIDDVNAYIASNDEVVADIQADIETINTTIATNKSDIETSLQTETSNRENADTTLQNNINTLTDTVTANLAEAKAYVDTQLSDASGNISDDISALDDKVENYKTTIEGEISDEADARAEADTNIHNILDTKIDKCVELPSDVELGTIVQYIGTPGTYKPGYFYKYVGEPGITFTPSGENCTTQVTTSIDDFKALLNVICEGRNFTAEDVVSGQIGYHNIKSNYSFSAETGTGKFFSISYAIADFNSAGVTFEPPLGPRQGVRFTCNLTNDAWKQVDVQPHQDISRKANIEHVQAVEQNLTDLSNIAVKYTDISTQENPNRKAIILDNHNGIFGKDTEGNTRTLGMISKYNVADFGNPHLHTNLNTQQIVTVNDNQAVLTDKNLNNILKQGENIIIDVDQITDPTTGFVFNQYTINAELSGTNTRVDELADDISDEVQNRETAVQSLQDQIDAIPGAINTALNNYYTQDQVNTYLTNIQKSVTDEESAREQADSSLQQDITSLQNSKVDTNTFEQYQASVSNTLDDYFDGNNETISGIQDELLKKATNTDLTTEVSDRQTADNNIIAMFDSYTTTTDLNTSLANITDTITANEAAHSAQHTQMVSQIATDIATAESNANDYTDTAINTLSDTMDTAIAERVEAEEELQQNIDDVDGRLAAVETDIETKANASDVYTKQEIDTTLATKLASIFKYKGQVSNANSLPNSNNEIGDCYNVQDTDANYAWNGSSWDKLSETIDLTPYVKTADLYDNIYTKEQVVTLDEKVTEDILKLIWSKPSDPSKGYFYSKKTNSAGGYALIFNETDGGGSQVYDKTANTVSYVGVNLEEGNGALDGVNVQIYSKDKTTNEGVRINVNTQKAYYLKGGTKTNTAEREIAVKADISALQDEIDSLDNGQTSLKQEIDQTISELDEKIDNEVQALNDTKADKTELESLEDVVDTKADTTYVDTVDGKIASVIQQLLSLEAKYNEVRLSNVEVISLYDGNDDYYEDGEKDYIMSGQIDTDLHLTAKSVSLRDMAINAAVVQSYTTGDFNLNNVEVDGVYDKNTMGNSVMSIHSDSYVTIRDCKITPETSYNGLEIGLTEGLVKGVIIDNVDFDGVFTNNAISIFGTAENCIITISNCHFNSVSNILRLSNRTGAKCTINLINCTCDTWETGTYSGAILCQDYTSQGQGNLFAPDKITINIQNLIGPNGKIESVEDLSTICGCRNNNQILYVYVDNVGFINYDATTYPKVTIL